MKTSELIEMLEESYADHGDRDVVVHVFDGYVGAFEQVTKLELNVYKEQGSILEIKHEQIVHVPVTPVVPSEEPMIDDVTDEQPDQPSDKPGMFERITGGLNRE